MPKQYEPAGNIGYAISTISDGLLQQRTDLWDREMPYWQKFMATSRYFDEFGMVALSEAVPQSSFFKFLQGLTTKEEAQTVASAKRPSSRKREEGNILPMGDVVTNNNRISAIANENPALASIYGGALVQPENGSARYGQEPVVPIENTAVYQSYSASYLNQQINEYLYQTEFVRQETHLHPTTVARIGSDKRRLPRQSLIKDNILAPKVPIAAAGGTEEKSSAVGRKNDAIVDGEGIAAVKDNKRDVTAVPGERHPLASLFSVYPSVAEESPDWSALCSLLRQSVAETFTELLQNMIPETEGR